MNEATKTIDNAKSFFELVDRYLIADLNKLVLEIESKESGGLGYPCIHTILVGMELLGMIMSGKTEAPAFYYFWDNYLQIKYPEYKNPALREIFRKVVRNGTAHIYFVKAGISINRTGPHLKVIEYRGDKLLHLNLKDLYSHFRDCYDEIKNKVLGEDKAYVNAFRTGYVTFSKQMEDASRIVSDFISNKKKEININTGVEQVQVRVEGIRDTSTSAVVTRPPNSWLKDDTDYGIK